MNFDQSVILESEQIETNADFSHEGIRSFSEFPMKRVDFSDWYTMTIDGSDAKDLDDAISLKKQKNGNYLLAVHIADVCEYVTE